MKTDKLLLDHGAGGELSHRLTRDILLPSFANPILERLEDGAVFDIKGLRFAFSTDTYTVDPIFFPGGDIGELAVNGTVNDLSMCGASPLYLSAAFLIEEGFPMGDLERIVASMARAAHAAGVSIVTGDTKVVPKGAADKIFINTSGVGLIPPHAMVGSDRAAVGDRVILSGTMADHGATVMALRGQLALDAPVRSDTAPLNHMVKRMFMICRDIHALRDPTRGGVGTALNEIAQQSKVGVRIFEDRLPIRPEVAGICDLLGFDPLYLANEGKLLAFVKGDKAEAILAAIQNDPHGKDACIIGEVVSDHPGQVVMQTAIGGSRIVHMLTGEQLPRIC
jgi:hydrogenase expression/formation protein HypE